MNSLNAHFRGNPIRHSRARDTEGSRGNTIIYIITIAIV